MAETLSTNPHHGRAGRHPTRKSLDDALKGHDDPGMFGPCSRSCRRSTCPMHRCKRLLKQCAMLYPGSHGWQQSKIPAGFTYLGQFVDHDITLDLTSIGEKSRDPLGLENFLLAESRSRLDLRSWALDGSPHLYERNAANHNQPVPVHPAEGRQGFQNLVMSLPSSRIILPRNVQGVRMIGDHRNDVRTWSSRRRTSRLKSFTTMSSTCWRRARRRLRTCSSKHAGS